MALSEDNIVKTLWVYPWPVTEEDVEKLKAAKANLDLAFKVVPRQATVGCPGRVLALRTVPNFLAMSGYALVRDLNNEDAVGSALGWAITDKEDSRATQITVQLSNISGKQGWREIPARQLAAENISVNLDLDNHKAVKFR